MSDIEELKNTVAEKILEYIEISDCFSRSIDAMLGQLGFASGSSPEELEVVRDFMNKYINMETLREDYLKMYVEVFTLEQLKGIESFYSTPIGQVLLDKSPEIMSRSAAIGSRIVEENQVELQTCLEALEIKRVIN